MSGQDIAVKPLQADSGSSLLGKLAALPSRNIRLTVLLCVVAIGGSFAAAGALQMRFQAANAARQSAIFEARRANDMASVAGATLTRQAAFGRAYLTGQVSVLPADVRGITVADMLGKVSASSGEPVAIDGLVLQAINKPVVFGSREHTVLAFRDGSTVVAIAFAPLVPDSALSGMAILGSGGAVVAGSPLSGEVVKAAVPGWPVEVRALTQDPDVMGAWYASLPLAVFVILGPALVGSWLATVFVREFERRAKAAEAIRALRSTRPAEARLLVRLANAERAAVEAARSKSEFIAHMSHELRTPLNAVIGFAEVIENGMYGPVGHKKYVEYAHDICNAGRNLHAKVGDILEFADLEAGRYPLNLIAFDVTELVNGCVSDNAGRAFSRRIDLSMLPAARTGAIADPQAVRRIVMSLLSNALLYTPEGGTVRVAVRDDVGAVAISITDSGKGFTPREHGSAGKAFRRFERAGVSSGTGLGLAIAVALARRMGGALRLQPAHGGGTTAEVRLPKR